MAWEGHKEGFAPAKLQTIEAEYGHIGIVRCETFFYPAKITETVSIEQRVVEATQTISETVEVAVS